MICRHSNDTSSALWWMSMRGSQWQCKTGYCCRLYVPCICWETKCFGICIPALSIWLQCYAISPIGMCSASAWGYSLVTNMDRTLIWWMVFGDISRTLPNAHSIYQENEARASLWYYFLQAQIHNATFGLTSRCNRQSSARINIRIARQEQFDSKCKHGGT